MLIVCEALNPDLIEVHFVPVFIHVLHMFLLQVFMNLSNMVTSQGHVPCSTYVFVTSVYSRANTCRSFYASISNDYDLKDKVFKRHKY